LFNRLKYILYKIIRWPIRFWDGILLQRTSRALVNSVALYSVSYTEYLQLQLKRTYLKRRKPLQSHTRVLVDRLTEQVELNKCRVLCIGCRNTVELDYFHTKGCQDVTGIDLHSLRADIKVMDMHHLKFPNDYFDIIYSSHSLEHALNPSQVIGEIIRVARNGTLVAIEVPIEFEPRGADLVDFKNLDRLHRAFTPYLAQVLWSEQYNTAERSTCIRTIFKVQK
jgi:SAM-dependent methyltransferase